MTFYGLGSEQFKFPEVKRSWFSMMPAVQRFWHHNHQIINDIHVRIEILETTGNTASDDPSPEMGDEVGLG